MTAPRAQEQLDRLANITGLALVVGKMKGCAVVASSALNPSVRVVASDSQELGEVPNCRGLVSSDQLEHWQPST